MAPGAADLAGRHLVADRVPPGLTSDGNGVRGEVSRLAERNLHLDPNALDLDDVRPITVNKPHLVQHRRLPIDVGVLIEVLNHPTGLDQARQPILEPRDRRAKVLSLRPVGVALSHLGGPQDVPKGLHLLVGVILPCRRPEIGGIDRDHALGGVRPEELPRQMLDCARVQVGMGRRLEGQRRAIGRNRHDTQHSSRNSVDIGGPAATHTDSETCDWRLVMPLHLPVRHHLTGLVDAGLLPTVARQVNLLQTGAIGASRTEHVARALGYAATLTSHRKRTSRKHDMAEQSNPFREMSSRPRRAVRTLEPGKSKPGGAVARPRNMAWLAGLPGIPPKAEREPDRGWQASFRKSLSLLFEYCLSEAPAPGPNLLEDVLLSEQRNVSLEWSYYWDLAAIGILLRGPIGVDRLAEILRMPMSNLTTSTIVESLWRASSRQPLLPQTEGITNHLPEFDLPEGVAEAAQAALDDLIIDAQSDVALLSKLLSFATTDTIGGAANTIGFADHFIQVSGESRITLTHRILDSFADMIQIDLPEERYQAFLKQHPVLLDPLSAEVLPKHKLGSDLITDFVIRRHDYRYIAVEIEKPQDLIFTRSNDFTAPFTHAFGQVLDFQRWIAGNVAYAKAKLPLIENPQGLLIIGQRSHLTEEQNNKLRWWQTNSKMVEVLTFDDLVERGRLLLRSLRRSNS
jgi:hypothetical protein